MRTLFAAALLAAATAASADPLPSALVWVPPESYAHWSRIDGLLRARPELKLTIALTPQMTTVVAKAALGPWAKEGRVEIAARIHGDPFLTYAAAHPSAPRPDDALSRAAEARAYVEKRLGAGAAGFVPGAGALDASLVQPLGAAEPAWVLAGPYAVLDSTWASSGRAAFVPARAAAADAVADELSTPGAFVVDESSMADAALPAVLDALRGRPAGGWATVSGLLKAKGGASADAAAISAWPAWDGALPAPPSRPGARAAWDAYGEAAKALERYQNSGAADLKVLEGATALLRKAQEARFYRAPAAGAPAGLPADLRARLLAVYKRVKAPAPESLYVGPVSTSTAVVDLPTGVHAASGPNWVAFDNPSGSMAKTPQGAANADPWKLRGLRVEWDEERVLLRLFPARADADPPAPRPVYDVYIDLNHVIGAGATRLLDGRGAFAQARDAWEFALSVCGGDARLWRAGPGDPEELGAFKAETDAARGEIRVTVPRDLLHGNPARWGYILLALAENPARAGRAPATTLVGADGSIALGVVGPLDVQKTVLEHPGAPQRVPAVRIESGR